MNHKFFFESKDNTTLKQIIDFENYFIGATTIEDNTTLKPQNKFLAMSLLFILSVYLHKSNINPYLKLF